MTTVSFGEWMKTEASLSEEKSTPVIPFGKYRGKPLNEVEPAYLTWMLRKAKSVDAWEGIVNFVEEFKEEIEAALDPSARAQRVHIDYTLTQSQSDAVKGIEQTLLMGDVHMMRLEGGAGYGKSFAVLDLVRVAMHHGYEVHACATSYVATQVLCEHLEPYGIQPKTIASLIRLAKIELEDQEQYEMTPETGDALSYILGPKNILIVDEYSMVGDEIATAMMERACEQGGKLLVVGDLKQLPPVKQKTDSVFAQIPDSVTLTEPMRYSIESDLYKLEQLARFRPRDIHGNQWSNSDQIHLHDDMSALISQYVEDYKIDPSSDSRILLFRRNDVLTTNAAVRYLLFGDRAALEPIIEDEALMVTATTDIPLGGEVSGEVDKIRFYSGTTHMVEHVEEDVIHGVNCYVVRFFGSPDEVPVIFAMGSTLATETKGAEQYQKILSELRKEAIETGQWGEWRRFKNSFLPVSYRYATTVHRAQGATVDRVYFSTRKLSGVDMSDKLIYVAATRAKKHVHVVL